MEEEAHRDLKQLKALLKLLREEGVTTFVDDKLSIVLGPQPLKPEIMTDEERPEREWTAHERLFAENVEPDEGDFQQ